MANIMLDRRAISRLVCVVHKWIQFDRIDDLTLFKIISILDNTFVCSLQLPSDVFYNTMLFAICLYRYHKLLWCIEHTSVKFQFVVLFSNML